VQTDIDNKIQELEKQLWLNTSSSKLFCVLATMLDSQRETIGLENTFGV
jgi:hypothetical protein